MSHVRFMKAVIGSLIFLIIALIVIFILKTVDPTQKIQQRGTMSEGFGQQETRVFDNVKYKKKWGIETFLFIGVDKTSDDITGPRDGGQADTLIVAVVDHELKQVSLLQIDRDTLADITVLGYLGDLMGIRHLQICLSHSYGETREQNDRYTVEAVSRMLDNLQFDGYFSMNLNNVTVVNHLLGGVTVSVEDDFSQWDPQMVPGAIVKLADDQAELFLHSRMNVGDGKNTSRMRRHREYLKSAIAELKEKMKSSASFSKKFLDGVIDVSHTDIAYGKIINELNLAYGYELLPIETLEGTHSIDEDGYVTFILDNGTVQRWITNRYYEPNT